ncbi:MAG: Uma2 family endonuclease [Bryobacterales bacterium]
MSVAVRKLTWDDLKDLPEDAGRTEIVDGDLVVSPTPSDRHQEISTALASKLYPFVRRHNRGKFYGAPVHVVLAEHVNFEPDLCFLATGNLHRLQSPVIAGPPDLVIEIISESNRTHDTVVKFQNYERYGVAEYWLVDQREQYISVWSLEQGRYVSLGAFAAGRKLQTHVLSGLDLDPAEIF